MNMNEDTPSEGRELHAILNELRTPRADVIGAERDLAPPSRSRDGRWTSRRNLQHYLGLRRRDIRPLQERLARHGLSSLGRCESHVLASVDAVIRILARAVGDPSALSKVDSGPSFDEGPALLEANAAALLGERPHGRSTRIMVTLSTEAADDQRLLAQEEPDPAGSSRLRVAAPSKIGTPRSAPGARTLHRLREDATSALRAKSWTREYEARAHGALDARGR